MTLKRIEFGHHPANHADDPDILAGRFPAVLHRTGLEPYLGAGRWRRAGTRQAYRDPGAARHGGWRINPVSAATTKCSTGRVGMPATWGADCCSLLAVLSPSGKVVIGIDDTIERRWGGKIKARGIYRDAVRSSHGHFVKTSGLRWLSFAVMLPIPFAGQRWALPFLTVLAPSARWSEAQGRRHKALTDWAKQAILQTKRWLPDRRVVVVADTGFSALELIAAVRRHVCFITRLRLDASLFEPAAKRQKGQIGRPALKGKRRPKLNAVLVNPKTVWTSIMLAEWYGGQTRKLEYVCGTAVWYHNGMPPAAIRWVLVRIRLACVMRRRFCPPTSTSNLPRSSTASCPAGGSRRPSKKHGNIWASRPSGNGRTWPSCARHRCCSASTRW